MSMRPLSAALSAALVTALALAAGAAQAQWKPTKPVTIIVPGLPAAPPTR